MKQETGKRKKTGPLDATALPAANSSFFVCHSSLVVCLLFVAGTLAVYWPVLHFEFVNFDDPFYVTQNSFTQRGLTWEGVRWAMTSVEAEFWHPLTWLSHMLDYQIYGPRAGGHHFTNVLLHLANTLLVFGAFRQMTGSVWRSASVAALFAWHPLHVESVAWIAERKDVLSAFFGLLSLWAYARYAQSKIESGRLRTNYRGWYLMAVVLFALSLMSKPMLVTLPFLLLLLDYWPLRRIQLKVEYLAPKSVLPLIVEKTPFLALSFAACVAAYRIQAHGHNLGGLQQYPLPLRLANVIVSYGRYLRKMIWPSDLAMFYPYPDFWPAFSVACAGLLLAIFCLLAVACARRRPYFAVGWFWFLGTLVPVIGLVQVSHFAMADRYTYLPLIGIFVMVVWGAAELAERLKFNASLRTVLPLVLLLCCAAASRRQAGYWENNFTLNEHALKVTTNNYIAHANLGAAFADQNNLQEALKQFQASYHIESVLRSNPDLPSIRFGLGTTLALQGKLDEAKEHLMRVLQVQPNVPRVHHNLASVFALQEDLDQAIAHYQIALRLNPAYDDARVNLAAITAQRQRWLDASAHFTAGDALLKEQRPKEAIDQFHQALVLRPDWAELLNNLAWLLATYPKDEIRNGNEAVGLAEHACDLTRGTNYWLLSTLAAAYAEAGRFPEAVKTQEKVCQLAAEQSNANSSEAFKSRLELYRGQHAYHRP